MRGTNQNGINEKKSTNAVEKNKPTLFCTNLALECRAQLDERAYNVKQPHKKFVLFSVIVPLCKCVGVMV